jgi:hypothetical protein
VKRVAPTFTLKRSPTRSAERELRAAAAGVEHDQRPAAQAEPRLHPEVGQAALLLAVDDLDLDTGPLAHGIDDGRAVGRDPHPRRADRGDRHGAVAARLLDHGDDRGDGARDALATQPARFGEALAESGDLRAVGDRPPSAVRAALADVELHRVRADVDHREAVRIEAGEGLELARHTHVRAPLEPELAPGRDHPRRVLGLDRDRPRRAVVRAQLRELHHRPTDGVVRAVLVHRDRHQLRARADHLVDELAERVLGPREVVRGRTQGLLQRCDLVGGQRELALRDRHPLLQPVVVDAHQALDVEQALADLHRRVAVEREHVQLVAVLLPLRRERGQTLLGGAEPFAERPPLPARDDLGHGTAGRTAPWNRSRSRQEPFAPPGSRRRPTSKRPTVPHNSRASCESAGRRRARTSTEIAFSSLQRFADRNLSDSDALPAPGHHPSGVIDGGRGGGDDRIPPKARIRRLPRNSSICVSVVLAAIAAVKATRSGVEIAMSYRESACFTSMAREMPRTPSAAAISAVMTLSCRIIRRAWRRVMPIVRSIPARSPERDRADHAERLTTTENASSTYTGSTKTLRRPR